MPKTFDFTNRDYLRVYGWLEDEGIVFEMANGLAYMVDLSETRKTILVKRYPDEFLKVLGVKALDSGDTLPEALLRQAEEKLEETQLDEKSVYYLFSRPKYILAL